MSFSKIKSNYASTSNLQIYKPQKVIPHVVRMQNLLEQYDRENSYLNKQVKELLGRKKQFDSRFGISSKTLNQFNSKGKNYLPDSIRAQALIKYPSHRQSSANKLKRFEYVDDNDKTRSSFQAKIRHTFDTSGRKQTKHYSYTPYQNIEEVDRSINNYKNSFSNHNSNRKEGVSYLQQHNNSTNIKKRQNSQRIPYTKPFFTVQEKTENRRSPNTTDKNRKESPETTSRFLNQQELRLTKQQVNRSMTNIEEETKIINKSPYIDRVNRESSPSLTGSPQKKKSITNINDSMISLKSNKSKKSGIEVTSPSKKIKIQKQQSLNQNNLEQRLKKQKEQIQRSRQRSRQRQIQRQRQRQKQRQRQIQRQKQIIKQKQIKIQVQTFRQRQRLLQIQKQIEIEKQKQKQRQLLRQRQKELQKQKQKRRQKQKQLQILRQNHRQINHPNYNIRPNQVQKTVTFADQIIRPTPKQITTTSYQQNQTTIKFPSTPYFEQKQNQLVQRQQLQQFKNQQPYKYQYLSYVPSVSSGSGQPSPYQTHNPFINKSQSLPTYQKQIQKPKVNPSQQTQIWNIQQQNIIGRKKSSQHRIEPSQKIVYGQGTYDLNRKQSSGSLVGNSKDKKKKFIKVISYDIMSLKSEQGQKK